MNTEEKDINSNGFITDATILALISAALYICAYAYDAGYLSQFNVPLQLTQIKIDTLLAIIFPSFAGVALILLIANAISVLWPETPEIQFKISGILLILIFPIWNLYLYGWRKEDLVIYIMIFTFLVVSDIIWPLIVHKDKKTLKEKFIADVRAEQGHYLKNLGSRIVRSLGIPIYTVIFIIFFGTMLAHNAGRAKSITQDEFYIFKDTPDVAIVRVYSDLLIGVGFDKSTMMLNNKIFLKKIDSGDSIDLTLEKIGQLKKDNKKP